MISRDKIFEIDLTKKQIIIKDYTEAMAREHLAGFGFNIKTLSRRLTRSIDPLGSENILIISRGLLTGTAAPASSRSIFTEFYVSINLSINPLCTIPNPF